VKNIILFIAVCCTSIASAQYTEYRTFTFDDTIAIDIPGNWRVESANPGNFAAYDPTDKTGIGIGINVNHCPVPLSRERFRDFSDQDLRDYDDSVRRSSKLKFVTGPTSTRITLNGIPMVITHHTSRADRDRVGFYTESIQFCGKNGVRYAILLHCSENGIAASNPTLQRIRDSICKRLKP
jgi:hypothetical protein